MAGSNWLPTHVHMQAEARTRYPAQARTTAPALAVAANVPQHGAQAPAPPPDAAPPDLPVQASASQSAAPDVRSHDALAPSVSIDPTLTHAHHSQITHASLPAHRAPIAVPPANDQAELVSPDVLGRPTSLQMRPAAALAASPPARPASQYHDVFVSPPRSARSMSVHVMPNEIPSPLSCARAFEAGPGVDRSGHSLLGAWGGFVASLPQPDLPLMSDSESPSPCMPRGAAKERASPEPRSSGVRLEQQRTRAAQQREQLTRATSNSAQRSPVYVSQSTQDLAQRAIGSNASLYGPNVCMKRGGDGTASACEQERPHPHAASALHSSPTLAAVLEADKVAARGKAPKHTVGAPSGGHVPAAAPPAALVGLDADIALMLQEMDVMHAGGASRADSREAGSISLAQQAPQPAAAGSHSSGSVTRDPGPPDARQHPRADMSAANSQPGTAGAQGSSWPKTKLSPQREKRAAERCSIPSPALSLRETLLAARSSRPSARAPPKPLVSRLHVAERMAERISPGRRPLQHMSVADAQAALHELRKHTLDAPSQAAPACGVRLPRVPCSSAGADLRPNPGAAPEASPSLGAPALQPQASGDTAAAAASVDNAAAPSQTVSASAAQGVSFSAAAGVQPAPLATASPAGALARRPLLRTSAQASTAASTLPERNAARPPAPGQPAQSAQSGPDRGRSAQASSVAKTAPHAQGQGAPAANVHGPIVAAGTKPWLDTRERPKSAASVSRGTISPVARDTRREQSSELLQHGGSAAGESGAGPAASHSRGVQTARERSKRARDGKPDKCAPKALRNANVGFAPASNCTCETAGAFDRAYRCMFVLYLSCRSLSCA